MCHVKNTIRGVFRGGSNGARVFSALSRHLESGVDPGNEVDQGKGNFKRREPESNPGHLGHERVS